MQRQWFCLFRSERNASDRGTDGRCVERKEEARVGGGGAHFRLLYLLILPWRRSCAPAGLRTPLSRRIEWPLGECGSLGDVRRTPAAAVRRPCFCECRATDCRGRCHRAAAQRAAGGVRGKTLVQKLEMLPAAAQVGSP